VKSFLIATAVAVVTVAAADAQYKTPAQTQAPTTQTGPGTVKIDAPGYTPAGSVGDELAKAKRISREDAMKMVKQNKAVYVDVRSKDSYDEGHLPGAVSIPLSELNARLKDLPPGKYLITYCA
jgi:3-mercaptopyruvate sulfurtransferase SseA